MPAVGISFFWTVTVIFAVFLLVSLTVTVVVPTAFPVTFPVLLTIATFTLEEVYPATESPAASPATYLLSSTEPPTLTVTLAAFSLMVAVSFAILRDSVLPQTLQVRVSVPAARAVAFFFTT